MKKNTKKQVIKSARKISYQVRSYSNREIQEFLEEDKKEIKKLKA